MLRAGHLGQPAVVTAAYAASVRALAAVLGTLNEQAGALQGQVEAYFGQHPDAEIVLSQPGPGPVPGARVLAESGDDPARYVSAKARKNYAGTSPITCVSPAQSHRLPRPGAAGVARDPRPWAPRLEAPGIGPEARFADTPSGCAPRR
ncbi:MAG: transposase [Streptosporangiaceae bacterium]